MSRIAKEIVLFLFCVVVAFLINAWSIATYHTQWSELFTTFHITLALALVFYVLLALLRIFIFVLRRLLIRNPA